MIKGIVVAVVVVVADEGLEVKLIGLVFRPLQL
jgi:hypothetical protein